MQAKVDELTDSLHALDEGDESGGNSSIMALKKAILTLKNQVYGMELSIGLLGSDLLNRKQIQSQIAFKKSRGGMKKGKSQYAGARSSSTIPQEYLDLEEDDL